MMIYVGQKIWGTKVTKVSLNFSVQYVIKITGKNRTRIWISVGSACQIKYILTQISKSGCLEMISNMGFTAN